MNMDWLVVVVGGDVVVVVGESDRSAMVWLVDWWEWSR